MSRKGSFEPGLTPQHLRIISCMGEGYRHKEICEELGVAGGTVSYHMNTIYRMLKMKNRSQIVRVAIAFGLCSPLCLMLLLTGCKSSTPAPAAVTIPVATNLPPLPKPVIAPRSMATKAVAPPKRDWILPIAYPANYTNVTLWELQTSLDDKTWTHVAYFSGGGTPSGNYDVHTGTNKLVLWRFKGTGP